MASSAAALLELDDRRTAEARGGLELCQPGRTREHLGPGRGDERRVLRLAAAGDGRVPGDGAGLRERRRIARDGEDLPSAIAGQPALVVAPPLVREPLFLVRARKHLEELAERPAGTARRE